MTNRYRKHRWKKWLRDDLFSEIRYLLKLEIINKQLAKIFTESKDYPKDSCLYWYINHVHSASITAGFYRLIDTRSDVISLKKLLLEVKSAPELISRRAYTRLSVKRRNHFAQKLEKEHLNKEFSQMAGSGQYISPAIISKDLRQINSISKTVAKFRHKFVGHHAYNQKRYKIRPTYEQTYDCIVALTAIFKKYHLLITGGVGIEVIEDSEKKDIENDLALFFNPQRAHTQWGQISTLNILSRHKSPENCNEQNLRRNWGQIFTLHNKMK